MVESNANNRVVPIKSTSRNESSTVGSTASNQKGSVEPSSNDQTGSDIDVSMVFHDCECTRTIEQHQGFFFLRGTNSINNQSNQY